MNWLQKTATDEIREMMSEMSGSGGGGGGKGGKRRGSVVANSWAEVNFEEDLINMG